MDGNFSKWRLAHAWLCQDTSLDFLTEDQEENTIPEVNNY
jgi:hypothetical protein